MLACELNIIRLFSVGLATMDICLLSIGSCCICSGDLVVVNHLLQTTYQSTMALASIPDQLVLHTSDRILAGRSDNRASP